MDDARTARTTCLIVSRSLKQAMTTETLIVLVDLSAND